MGVPSIKYTPTVQAVLNELGSKERIPAADIVRRILERHAQYGSRTSREVNSGPWPEFERQEFPQEWMYLLEQMFDPLLTDSLHGRLTILGLCRLDETLGEHLRSFSAELKKELIEDFESLLLPKFSGEERYRRDFLKILQNKAKLSPDPDFPKRSNGFLILAEGGRRLDVLEKLCFHQRYNSCLTAYYHLQRDSTLKDLLQMLIGDLRGIVSGEYGTTGSFLPEVGTTKLPGVSQHSWEERVDTLLPPTDSPMKEAETERILKELFSTWGSQALTTGQRLVIFIEWRTLPNGTNCESIGLTNAVLQLLQSMPERVGIVISGLPESVRSEVTGTNVYPMTLPRDRELVRSQALANDTPVGPDRLNILDEVQVLADAVALKEMNPPMVVGVFGGWGSGKSFVLHLIAQRLHDIRCEGIPSEVEEHQKFPFVGHPYLVHFDAWTFAKSNLWASLMQTTLVELDRQLSLEHELSDNLKIDLKQNTPVWRLLGDLTDKQRDQLLKNELGREALKIATDFEQKGSPGKLWQELENLRAAERGPLKTEEDALRDLRKELAVAQRELEDEVDHEISADARRLAWIPVWQEILRLARGKLKDTDAPTYEEVVNSISAVRKFWLGLRKLSLPAAVFMVVAIAGGFIVSGLQPVFKFYGEAAGLLLASIAPVLRAWDWFEKRRNEYEERLSFAQETRGRSRQQRIDDTISIASEDSKGVHVAQLKDQVEEKEATVDRIRARIGVTGHSRSLNDFLKTRIEEGLYQKELGLLDQVQGDINELSDTLIPSRATGTVDRGKLQKLFPRGDPRVILLIDDLDRCPPAKVVDVLEAAQLLVKTRLFVVVIAMDVRYVTRALEAQYKDVLVRSGEPSGLDYIEKIIQIPYRVRTVSAPAIRSFLRSQMELVETDSDRPPDQIEPVLQIEPQNVATGDTEDYMPEGEETKARLAVSAQSTHAQHTELPTQVIKFTAEELAAVSASSSSLAVSPRTMKRLVNVFKLLKIIWYRQGIEEGPSMEVKKAILSLLALCARYPEVLRKLLADMEAAYRGGSSPGSQNIVEFLVERCKQGAEVALYPPDWHRVAEAIQRNYFFPVDLTFSRLEEANLHLLSSFSFVGETDSEREATLQRGYYKNALANAANAAIDLANPDDEDARKQGEAPGGDETLTEP